MKMGSVPADGILSALFIDYDNIYLSLKNRNQEAAARFARNPVMWISQLMNGRLIKGERQRGLHRRIAVARCYGNPVPWRQGRNGPEDPHCFARVRHHFLRAGMEVVDCPKVTSQFKNASDIRIACDIRDFIDHRVRYDEFIILSGDSDFTPVLLNLRSYDRRRVIYTNEYTSPYYRAFCDGWVEEPELINALLQMQPLSAPEAHAEIAYDPQYYDYNAPAAVAHSPAPALQAPPSADQAKRRKFAPGEGAVQSLIDDFKAIGQEITQLVVDIVEKSQKPVPLAFLADRAQKMIGQPKTVGTNWAGSGGFLNFLQQNLPPHLKISDKPPQVVYNPAKHKLAVEGSAQEPAPRNGAAMAPPQPAASSSSKLGELQQSITRIYTACQAPPLPPSEYQLLFTLIAAEVRDHGFRPNETAAAVVARAQDAGLKLSPGDVAFVLGAVDEIDPWLERTQSAAAVARAYRDYVLRRCQAAGLNLTDDEHQLIQVWFGASQWGQQRNENNAEKLRGPSPLPRAPFASPRSDGFGHGDAGNDRKYGSDLARRPASPQAGERSDIPLPPDFCFEPEPQIESPLDLGARSPIRLNLLK